MAASPTSRTTEKDSYGFVVPGDPKAQGRGRAAPVMRQDRTPVLGKSGRPILSVYNPKGSAEWRGAAKGLFMSELNRLGIGIPLFCEGPIALDLSFVFKCPKSQHRKRIPRPWQWCQKKPDLDNLIKLVLDAGSGVLWTDDRQVVEIHSRKWIAEQGGGAMTSVRIWRVEQCAT